MNTNGIEVTIQKVRIRTLRFLFGWHTRQLNQAIEAIEAIEAARKQEMISARPTNQWTGLGIFTSLRVLEAGFVSKNYAGKTGEVRSDTTSVNIGWTSLMALTEV